MKKLVCIFAILVLPLFSQAQKIASSFQEAEKAGHAMAKLDAAYKSALHTDTTKAVFNGQEEEFMLAYQQMLQDLGGFLKENDFKWGKKTRCFNRIYFAKDGAIDYFLFNFNADQISEKKQRQFNLLLHKFVQNYKIGIKGKEKFAQCSPVSYTDL